MISIQRFHNDHLYSVSKQTKSRKYKQRATRGPKRKDRDIYKPRRQRTDKGENLRCWKQLNTQYLRQATLEFHGDEQYEDNIDLDLYMCKTAPKPRRPRRRELARIFAAQNKRDTPSISSQSEHSEVESEPAVNIVAVESEPEKPKLKLENYEEFDLQLHRDVNNGTIEIKLEHLVTKDLYTVKVTNDGEIENGSISTMFLKIQGSASWSAVKVAFTDKSRFVQIDLRSDESVSSIVALIIKIEAAREQRLAELAAEEKKCEGEYEAEMVSIADTGRGQYCAIEGLVDRHSFASHKNDKADPTSMNMKKIMREIRKDLRKNVCLSHNNGSMFIRFDEGNPRFLQAMLTGLKGTPYFNGCFLFDVYLCDDYPVKPLQIKHVSRGATKCHANNGPGGFSPNLHQSSGKVCLSLLGTWSGPGWQSNVSNVYQVLSSLLFMVFAAEHPYYMEPNYGGWEGTVANKKTHDPKVIEYDEEVLFHTAKSTILGVMRTPYEGFEDVIRAHFKVKAAQIRNQMREVVKDEQYSKGFRERMQPIIEEIEKELEKLEM